MALAAWGCSESEAAGPSIAGHQSISAVFQQECSVCHQPQRLNNVSFASLSEASALVHRMVHNGADLYEDEELALCRYIYQLCGGGDDGIGEW